MQKHKKIARCSLNLLIPPDTFRSQSEHWTKSWLPITGQKPYFHPRSLDLAFHLGSLAGSYPSMPAVGFRVGVGVENCSAIMPTYAIMKEMREALWKYKKGRPLFLNCDDEGEDEDVSVTTTDKETQVSVVQPSFGTADM